MTKKKNQKETKKSEETKPKMEEPSVNQIQTIMNLCTEQQLDLLVRMNDVISEQQKFYTNAWGMWSKFNDDLCGSVLSDFGKERYKQISGVWNEHYGKLNASLLENTQKSTGKYAELFGKWRTIADLINGIATSSEKEQRELTEKLKKEYEEVSRYTAAFFAENSEERIGEYNYLQSSWLDFTNRMNTLLTEITTDENAYKMMAEGGMHQMFTPGKTDEVLVNWNKISSEINGEIAKLVSDAAGKFKDSQENWNEFLGKVMVTVEREK